jgi:hypothetical protein
MTPTADPAFVAAMEDVLKVYERPYDPAYPVVCCDEASKQLIADTYDPQAVSPKQPARVDHEYKRMGVRNLFMVCEPLANWREVTITERRTMQDWARLIRQLLDGRYKDAKKVMLVMDNLNIHSPAAMYATFPPEEARRLWERLEVHYTPKHGSWLDMAEIELSVLTKQCLSRRISDAATLIKEVTAWHEDRNNKRATVNWQYTTRDARTKLKHLYPSVEG